MAARQDSMERRTLWIVLALNIGLAVAFFATGAFGGYKQSGIGREWGDYGFEEFLEVKAVFGNQPA